MLNKAMWNIFEETGNIYAYLYVRECNEHLRECGEYYYNKSEGNNAYIEKQPGINGVTITT